MRGPARDINDGLKVASKTKIGVMGRVKYWVDDLMGAFAGSLCWFTPEHCNHVATFMAMLIGFFTFFFITAPKAWVNIKKCFKGKGKGK